MKKPKYERPIMRSLSQVQSAEGLCYSGNPEYSPSDPCTDGGQAVPSCNIGTYIYPIGGSDCVTGDYPGSDCFNGYHAA
jgi:hypothetical protein